MKKMVLLMMCMILAMQVTKADDVVTKDVNKLPAAARVILKKYFSEAKISYIKIDKELFQGAMYETTLTTGAEVDFDSEGQWTEIDCKKAEVPAGLIPLRIRNYILSNFQNEKIEKIERNRRGYKVELSGGLDLVFDEDGAFLRMED